MAGTSRRAFLRLAGVGALGVAVAGCGVGGKRPGPTGVSGTVGGTTAPATTSFTPRPPDWAGLRSRLGGRLVLPGEPKYGAAATPFNLAVAADHQPAAIATCTSAADVQACLDEVRASRVPAAARSGGHSYAGYSTPGGGLVIDLGGLPDVEVRLETAVIGAGARLGDVYQALGSAGRALPAGSCASVGISGLTMGGGIGVLARKFGLTCDRLRSATVVTGDGRVVTASEQSEPELFWAIRGGGGGNFGIVTSFEFETVPAPSLTIFALKFPAGAAADVLGAWQDWIAQAPDELWSNLGLTGGGTGCRVGGCYVGSPGGLNPLLDDFARRTGGQATSRTVTPKSYLAAMDYFSGSSDKQGFVASSRILARPLSDPGQVVELVRGKSGLDVLFDGLGGAVGRIGADATAFPHRGAIASAQVYRGATGGTRASAAAAVDEVQQGLSGLLGSGAYVNYLDPAQRDWAQAYYGSNLARLQAVARKYDPDGLLAFPQSVTRG